MFHSHNIVDEDVSSLTDFWISSSDDSNVECSDFVSSSDELTFRISNINNDSKDVDHIECQDICDVDTDFSNVSSHSSN